MTKAQKRQFIRSFMGSIQKEMLSQVANMPEEWDGIELRYHIGQKLAWEVEGLVKRNMDRKRLSNYRSEVYSRNL